MERAFQCTKPLHVRRWRAVVEFGLVVLLAASAAVYFWYFHTIRPATLPVGLGNVDHFTYAYPQAKLIAQSIREGAIPLWNPFQMCGQPFLAVFEGQIFYPPALLYLILPTEVALEVINIFHHAASMLLMYWLGRAMGLQPVGSLAGALVFAFSGFVIGQVQWVPQPAAAAVWLPLAFIALEKIFRAFHPVYALILAAAVALSILGAFMQYSVYGIVAIALYACTRLCWLAIERHDWAKVARAGAIISVGLALGFALTAVQVLPTAELQQLSPRRPGGITIEQALAPGGSWGFTRLFREMLASTPDHPRAGYFGVATLLLTPLALFLRPYDPRVWCFLFLGGFAIAGAIDAGNPLFPLIRKLPAMAWFRVPVRLLYLLSFAAAALTAITVDALYTFATGSKTSALKWRVVSFLGVLSLAMGLLYARAPLRTQIYLALATALIAGALFVTSKWPRVVALVGLLLLLGYDLFTASFNKFLHPYHTTAPLYAAAAAFQYVRERQGLDRTYIYDPSSFNYALMQKQGTLQGIFSVTDYEPLSLRRWESFFKLMYPPLTPRAALMPFAGSLVLPPQDPRVRLLDLLSVRFVVGHRLALQALSSQHGSPDQHRPGAWRLAFQGGGTDYVVWERHPVLPRAYLAYNTQHAPTEAAALEAVADPAFDPWSRVVVEDQEATLTPSGNALPITPAHIVTYQPTRVTIEVFSNRPALLVLNDTFYPGWRATVDGRAVPIYRANFLFRGVPVEPGSHTVVFEFTPWNFRLGAALSIVGLVGALLLAVHGFMDRTRLRRRYGVSSSLQG